MIVRDDQFGGERFHDDGFAEPHLDPFARLKEGGGVVVDLGPEDRHAVVVTPDLAVGCSLEESGFKGRVFIDPEGVDDAGCLLRGEAVDATYPLAAVTECTKTVEAVGTVERGDEKVPERVENVPWWKSRENSAYRGWHQLRTHESTWSGFGP